MIVATQALGTLIVHAGVRLTTSSPTPSPNATPRYLDDAIVRPGFLGFAVFLALAAASYFLFRSMQRQLKRVNFDEQPPERTDVPDPRDSSTG